MVKYILLYSARFRNNIFYFSEKVVPGAKMPLYKRREYGYNVGETGL